jgi:hypothetical protein
MKATDDSVERAIRGLPARRPRHPRSDV